MSEFMSFVLYALGGWAIVVFSLVALAAYLEHRANVARLDAEDAALAVEIAAEMWAAMKADGNSVFEYVKDVDTVQTVRVDLGATPGSDGDGDGES